MSPRLIVVGPPGAGKTEVGTALAARLGLTFRDADQEIVQQTGKSIADIFTDDGETAFRAIEERVIADELAGDTGVLSLGGGAVLSAATRDRLAGHTVVFLNVDVTEGVRRTGLSAARPLLAGVNPRVTWKALADQRLPLYRSVAAVEIATERLTIEQVVDEVLTQLRKVAAIKESQ